VLSSVGSPPGRETQTVAEVWEGGILLQGNHLIEIQNIFGGTNEAIFQLNIRYTTHIVTAENYSTVSHIPHFVALAKENNILLALFQLEC
jgi:hypothetical protein